MALALADCADTASKESRRHSLRVAPPEQSHRWHLDYLPPSEIDFKAPQSACSELNGNEWCNCIPLIENLVTGLLRRFE